MIWWLWLRKMSVGKVRILVRFGSVLEVFFLLFVLVSRWM